MSRISSLPVIRLEDFKQEDQPMAEQLGRALNPFMSQVYRQVNGNLGFENLNRQLKTVEVKIDNSGAVINNPQVKIVLRSKVAGLKVISAINEVNSRVYPVSAPFISYTTNNDILTIVNVTGLQNNSTYSLTIEIIGN